MKIKHALGLAIALGLASPLAYAQNLIEEQSLLTPPPPQESETAMAGWTKEITGLVLSELAARGYSQEKMAEEAKAIEAMVDESAKAKAVDQFYSHYQGLAMQVLQDLAYRSKQPKVIELAFETQRLLQFRQPDPKVDLPKDILLIYRQMGDAVVLTESPCMDWEAQFACALAPLIGQECSRVTSNWSDLPSRGIRTIARVTDDTAVETVEHCSSISSCSAPRAGYYQRTSFEGRAPYHWENRNAGAHGLVFRNYTGDDRRVFENAIGIGLPVQRRDHAMCVAFNAPPRTAYLWGFSADYPVGAPELYAYAAHGQRFDLGSEHIEPLGGSRSARGDCYAAVVLPPRSPSGHESVQRVFSSKACWYGNLEYFYNKVMNGANPQQFTYPPNPVDPDTHDALNANVWMVSQMEKRTASSNGGHRVSGGIIAEYGSVEVVVIRDQ